ncbi:hypothetical protein [Synoicihabitans lomoniglobus]|uniref:Uncharacterized protein n=1 Tax=Synoicihabitans lomoniglobus TaxID=2909285 RepID=A0AAE9ZY69_9BACT|nr:hypothetical protein [Opitutaceae bacterium LMO-M01]WED65185.1 hypothetical protein PXH66_22840 [Opitutaceae bacterium LMO-M01]
MKIPHATALALLGMAGVTCAQTEIFEVTQPMPVESAPAQKASPSPDFLPLQTDDIALVACHHAASGLQTTAVAFTNLEPGSSASGLAFTLIGGNHLLMATLGRKHHRASTLISLPGDGERHYRLNVLREGKRYRFLVWNDSGADAARTLVADVFDQVPPSRSLARSHAGSSLPGVTAPGKSTEGGTLGSFW